MQPEIIDDNSLIFLAESRLCSAHFISGKKNDDSESPDFIPSVFPTGHVRPQSAADVARFERRKYREERLDALKGAEEIQVPVAEDIAVAIDIDDPMGDPGDNEQEGSIVSAISDMDISMRRGSETDSASEGAPKVDNWSQTPKSDKSKGTQYRLQFHVDSSTSTEQQEPEKMSSALPFHIFQDRQVVAFTGVNRNIHKFLLYRIGSSLKDSKNITRELKLALVLTKLKMNIRFIALAAMFDVSQYSVKGLFTSTLHVLRNTVKDLIIWFSKDTVRARMPADFRKHFPRTRAIIDASEIECSVPDDPTIRVKMYSNYKKRHTMKFLVSCAPSGEVTFVSRMYGGRCTDTELTIRSGFIHLIEPGDEILADKGTS